MAKIFITGSTDGLGLLAAKALIHQGQEVYLHARNQARKEDVLKKITGAKAVFVGDISDITQTKQLANTVNKHGKFDVVIHNAGIYTAIGKDIFMVNVIAPYILTCLIEKPQRLIYLSSDMHLSGHSKLNDLKTNTNSITYSDSKLHVLMLCKAFARIWPQTYINAIHPGWVPTKMGGKGAPDNLQMGYDTQVWLATSNDKEALVNGKYFFHKKQSRYSSEADDISQQNKLLSICEEISGVKF